MDFFLLSIQLILPISIIIIIIIIAAASSLHRLEASSGIFNPSDIVAQDRRPAALNSTGQNNRKKWGNTLCKLYNIHSFIQYSVWRQVQSLL